MSIRKRILALAAAGALAVVLGGVVSSHHSGRVEAAGASQAAIGCANSNNPLDIAFATTIAGTITTSNQQPSGANPVTAGVVAPGTLSVATPNAVTMCGAVFEDAVPAAAVAGQDLDPSTIDGGTITFSLTSAVATILESNSTSFSVNCGSANGVTGFESCQGAQLQDGVQLVDNGCLTVDCAWASPTSANTVHVALRPGATFPLINAASPVVLIGATWNRYPSVSAAAGVLGGSTLSTNTSTIGIVVPAYVSSLGVGSGQLATIPGAMGTGVGTTLVFTIYHLVPSSCSSLTAPAAPIASGALGNPGFVICLGGAATFTAVVPGAESGVVTFSTSLGVFGSTTPGQGGSQQIYSVHCGQLPNTSPLILIPTFGLSSYFSLTACISANATLYGGGSAGTAIIVANYVGDFTGSTTQATDTVSLSSAPATVALSRGCNEVVTSSILGIGTSIATGIVPLVLGTSVVSVWQYSNALQKFQAGFFSTQGAPTDISTVGPNQSLFICVVGAGSFPAGTN